MPSTLTKAEIVSCFSRHIHCSQVVFGQWAEELGYDQEEAYRLAAPFGGGMFRGDTCGAVSGALLALGLRFGPAAGGDEQGDARLQEKVAEFQRRFTERCGSTVCRELLGYDFSQEGQRVAARASGAFAERCPDFVNAALAILDEMMNAGA